jgi:hypothetical protein
VSRFSRVGESESKPHEDYKRLIIAAAAHAQRRDYLRALVGVSR